MSIMDTFDSDGLEIINPYQVVKKEEGFPETVVVVFSQRFSDLVLSIEKQRRIWLIDKRMAVQLSKWNALPL